MTNEKEERRIVFISFLQFIGVISVIFGHSMNGIPVPAVLSSVKAWIYTWHMPLFFFVSAFLFSYYGGYDRGYKNVFEKRFLRLIVPYFLWNMLFIIPKYLFLPLLSSVSKDSEIEFSFVYFIRIILRPRDNILGHTWFLFALFEMFVIAIIFDKAKKRKELWIPITLILVIIYCFGVTNRWFSVGDLMKNGVFFWIGMLLGTYDVKQINDYFKNRLVILSTAILVLCSTTVWMFNSDMNINSLLLGFSVLFFFVALQIVTNIRSSFIDFVSCNSFTIYILHWPVIMLLRLFFYQKMNLNPVIAIMINFVLGFALPSVIAFVLRKNKIKWIRSLCTVFFGM